MAAFSASLLFQNSEFCKVSFDDQSRLDANLICVHCFLPRLAKERSVDDEGGDMFEDCSEYNRAWTHGGKVAYR